MIDDNGAEGQATADPAHVGRKAAWVTPTLVLATISGQTRAACTKASNAEAYSDKVGS
jgi:hypothetical protein